MLSFVLVHGAVHGAWCWERIIPHLEADPRVSQVVAVDLPGHGSRRDSMPTDEIGIADYVDAVVADTEAHDLGELVLVGHSLAGITIGHAAVLLADRMRHLVHLSTCVPEPGSSVTDMLSHPLSPVSRGLDLEAIFCNDLDAGTTEWLLERLEGEPPGPSVEPVVAAELPPDLPATYIMLEQDAALPPALQRIQAANAGIDDVVSFDAGHEAFLSRPRDLAALLLRYG